jgi:hypothetical protein
MRESVRAKIDSFVHVCDWFWAGMEDGGKRLGQENKALLQSLENSGDRRLKEGQLLCVELWFNCVNILPSLLASDHIGE